MIVPIQLPLCYRLVERRGVDSAAQLKSVRQSAYCRESIVTLNGWQRLIIVLAMAWALGVSFIATVEYQIAQDEPGDGFFTCWEPAARRWGRACHLFPQSLASRKLDSLFGAVHGGPVVYQERYLNLSRLLLVLLGPLIATGLGILAIRWIVMGFRSPEAFSNMGAIASAQLELPPSNLHKPDSTEVGAESHAQAWLDRLPRRWARNAAIMGGGLAALSVLPFLSGAAGGFITALLTGVAAIAISLSGGAYLLGLWARHSLKAPFLLSPTAALGRMTSTWMTGAILLGALVLASDLLFGWRKTAPLFAHGISADDLGYLTGLFGTWALIGYVTAVISRRGLRRAIEADRASASARPKRPRVPPNSLQHDDQSAHQTAYSSSH